MFYNETVCRKAGLLDADGSLKPIHGPDELTAALRAAQRVTGHYGGVVAVTNDPSTNLRFFATLYYQLGGTFLADHGTKITIDDDLAIKALTYLRSLTRSGLMPSSVDPTGVTSLFSTGKAGFLFDGEWQIPTYEATSLKFNVVPVPHLYGPKLATYADSHSFVIPTNGAMDAERRSHAVTFIKSILQNSRTWAKGGHIPAWLPVRDSAAFKAMKPQANYVAAADAAQYDPPGWYSGAGSEFENVVGAAIAGPSPAPRRPRVPCARCATACGPTPPPNRRWDEEQHTWPPQSSMTARSSAPVRPRAADRAAAATRTVPAGRSAHRSWCSTCSS